MHQLPSVFERVCIVEGEFFSNGRTGFPRHLQSGVRHGLFRRDEVFILAAAGALTDNQMGLCGGADLLHDLTQTDVLPQVVGTDPAAVEPEHVNFPVIAAQLPNLLVNELHILFPELRVLADVIVDVARGSRAELRGPVVRAVPVRFGKIGGDGHAAAAEFPVERADDIRVAVRVEGAVGGGDLVVRGFRIVHAEAVMVLGGEQKILEAAFLCKLRPGSRVELHGVEGFVCVPILLLAFLARGPGEILLAPCGVAVAQRPAFVGAQLAARRPVHHKAELEPHEPFQVLLHLGRAGRNILLRGCVVVNSVGDNVLFHAVPFPSYF